MCLLLPSFAQLFGYLCIAQADGTLSLGVFLLGCGLDSFRFWDLWNGTALAHGCQAVGGLGCCWPLASDAAVQVAYRDVMLPAWCLLYLTALKWANSIIQHVAHLWGGVDG
jgi:hypothetical protein